MTRNDFNLEMIHEVKMKITLTILMAMMLLHEMMKKKMIEFPLKQEMEEQFEALYVIVHVIMLYSMDNELH
ncbi:MAG: hypothetical protein EZS28_025460, partial [Streblomastix strix]